jgi:hypothetical protein
MESNAPKDREHTTMDEELGQADDPLVQEQADAAAAEAAGIGGPAPDFEGDEARRPVEEAGGGVAEGFEESERQLVEQASHGDAAGNPEADAFTPEVESDRVTAVNADADEVEVTEVVRDPGEGFDDPGRGPGITSER